MLWGYTERVPLVVFAPGIVAPSDSIEPVTLADVAPTTGQLLGHTFSTSDGRVLPGVPKPSSRLKVIVTYVIDGGGWNVLYCWPDAWPNLKRLMDDGANFRNAMMGSFPSVTASAHATIGTGMFPMHHGISGHNLRRDGHVQKAWGDIGSADPSYLLVPTLAMDYADATNHQAWIGEIGYQIWHLGMTSDPGKGPGGKQPVAIYWDEDVTNRWQSQNPDLFRMPEGLPERQFLTDKLLERFGPVEGRNSTGRGRGVLFAPDRRIPERDHRPGPGERTHRAGRRDQPAVRELQVARLHRARLQHEQPEPEIVLTQVDLELGRVRRCWSRRSSRASSR